ncbi:MAG: di-trans,poly-cis-decaprenylcistransferase, partial [candidate division Zixibacteria bacterium]|nr:di-trans,poly-cis-decaprenylcistransferase [candidate division Zixibacteria bacterium]
MMQKSDSLKETILNNPEPIPRHVAIIMDGNGRWAARRNKPRTFGHEAGVKAVKKTVRAASEIGIQYLTLYTFSIENWKRPRQEVAALMSLLSRTTRKEIDELMKNDVKLITTGRISGLSVTRRKVLARAEEKTR